MIISTVLSEKPTFDGDTLTTHIVRAGTKAYDEKGNEYEITQEAIDSSAETYSGGIITVNHKKKEKGKIDSSWKNGEYIDATVAGISPELKDIINSPAYRGVSQESIGAEFDEDDPKKITKLTGTGLTFVFYPENPACPLNKGCGVPIASTVDDDLNFNFPLNTHNQNSTKSTPGGVNISETDQKLESTISELETENKNLKSTIEKLQKELNEKDGKIESTVNAAVKAALESHDKALKEQTEREAVFSELKSSVSPETLDGLKDAPVSILKSTLAAIKETAGKHVGANSGTGTQSTGDDTDYASLGVTSIEVE
jgi:hypothetical protein